MSIAFKSCTFSSLFCWLQALLVYSTLDSNSLFLAPSLDHLLKTASWPQNSNKVCGHFYPFWWFVCVYLCFFLFYNVKLDWCIFVDRKQPNKTSTKHRLLICCEMWHFSSVVIQQQFLSLNHKWIFVVIPFIVFVFSFSELRFCFIVCLPVQQNSSIVTCIRLAGEWCRQKSCISTNLVLLLNEIYNYFP